METATTAAAMERHASGYKLKFDREEFLQLFDIANPHLQKSATRTSRQR